MRCRYCKVEMIFGTSYEKKKKENDKGYRRFHECQKCKDKVYNNAPNFQEMLVRSTENYRSK